MENNEIIAEACGFASALFKQLMTPAGIGSGALVEEAIEKLDEAVRLCGGKNK